MSTTPPHQQFDKLRYNQLNNMGSNQSFFQKNMPYLVGAGLFAIGYSMYNTRVRNQQRTNLERAADRTLNDISYDLKSTTGNVGQDLNQVGRDIQRGGERMKQAVTDDLNQLDRDLRSRR